MLQPIYHCSQADLYEACRVGWSACSANIDSFTLLKPKYTLTYVTDRLAEVDAAKDMLDNEQRIEDSKTARVALKNKATEALDAWQKLKRYISDAYPKDLLQIKLSTAGQKYYQKAANDDWGAVERLLNNGNIFITANTANLTANNNMPSTFAASFAAIKLSFTPLYVAFTTAEQNDEVETEAKIQANNDIYAKLIRMFKDGQVIFTQSRALRRQFVFEQVLLTVKGPGVAGIRGLITDNQTNRPITVQARVSVYNTTYTTNSDSNGRYEISPVAAGSYYLQFFAPNYYDAGTGPIAIETGTIKTVNISLVPQGYIFGRITDGTTGNPVENVNVVAEKDSNPVNDVLAVTDTNGNYSHTLVAGSYVLKISKAGYADMQVALFTVARGQTITKDLQMTPAHT